MSNNENSTPESAMRLALEAAREWLGATAPNPPVGAVGLREDGSVIATAAHERAGQAHAEAQLVGVHELHTVVVTLEPCNHQGKTPPCAEALISAGVKRVIYGTRDQNPRVAGRGHERLAAAGVEVISGVLEDECRELISGFSKWVTTGFPFVTVKTAHDLSGSMVPPKGQKTFTSPASLHFAHLLRKQSDAILTGSGTILADDPEFTVRHVPDHAGKRRWLAILDRRGRVPGSYLERARGRGFDAIVFGDLDEAIHELGRRGCHHVLVEAGPNLSEALLSTKLWDRHVLIRQGEPGEEDRIETRMSHV